MSGVPALDYDYQNCIAYTTDMKVRLSTLNLFYYPDLTVTCDDRDRIGRLEAGI